MKIDSHHHFWSYSAAEYPWIGDAMAELRRDFLPADLLREIAAAGIDGVVSVQARQSIAETEWLLSLAERNDFIKAVVGWVPLAQPDVRAALAAFAPHPKFRAVRHVVQEEPDDRFILREDFNRGVSALKEFGLVYDILIFERHLPAALEFVDRHPQQVFVLDHIGKPRIRDGAIEPWKRNITELARRENVFCKVSGMATEADWKTWTEAQLRPYFDAVLEAFGPRRLMFGTDWPVCVVATAYSQWLDLVSQYATGLSAEEQAWLFGRTAVAAYGLR